jgi:hypothetical protein
MIVRGQREGISLADDMRKSTPLLANELGLDLAGHIRRIGVMVRLQELCKIGDLPFTATIEHMPHGTWHWLNLRSGNFVAQIARTETFNEVPEDTKNRQHYLVKNDGDLFSDPKIVPISEIKAKVDRFYAYLTFGATRSGQMTHSTLGMAAKDELVWLGHHDLLRAAGEGAVPTPEPAPKFDPKDKLKFNERIEELLKPELDRKDEK